MRRSSSRRRVARVGNLTLALAALAACGGGDDSGTVVTEPVNHQETRLAPAGPDLQVAAADYVRTYNDELDLGLSSNDDYDVFSVTEADGLRHARMQQVYSGVPIFGADLVVHADDTTFLGFNGYVTKNLEGFDITTTVAEDAAMNAAKDDLAGGVSLTYADEESKLVILPGDKEGANLAWYVKFRNERSGDIEPGIWNYFIDAKTGAVLKKFDSLYTIEQGSGPGGSPKKARAWAAELDVETMGAEFIMDTPKLQTLDRSMADMVIRSMDLALFPDTEGNNAHGFAEVTLNMMRDWMGRESLDDAGFKIISRVHDTTFCRGAPLNACWDGTQMTYGDGGAGIAHPFAGSLDVVAHELNHGFTQFHSNLTYANQSGALNESFSDIAGACAEAYSENAAADMLVGEDIYIAGDALRYMCDPTMDGMSLDDAGDYADGIDVHYTSGIPNRAFCLAVGRFQVIWGGTDAVTATSEIGHIFYTANGSYWTAGTTFEQACRATIDAARALGWDGEATQALADSWADVGVECESDVYVCNSDGACDAAGGETCASCNEDCGPCEGQGPCSIFKKAKCALGIGDCSDCEGNPGCGDGVCNSDETDENCGQDCGCAALNCESVAPFGCWCDFECEDYGDCCSDYAMCE